MSSSNSSQRAAFDAAVVACLTGARLTYVHAVDTSFLKEVFADPLSRAFEEEMLVRIGMSILESAERMAKARGVTPDKYIKEGMVWDGLLAVAEELDADLLILGERSGTIVKRTLFHAGDGLAAEETVLSAGRAGEQSRHLHA